MGTQEQAAQLGDETRGAALPEIAADHPELVQRAVATLRTDGVVILRGLLDPATVERFAGIIDDWHARFLAGEIQNYSLDDETATEMPDMWVRATAAPRPLQSLRKWNAVGLDASFLDLVDGPGHYDVMTALLGSDLAVTKTQFLVVPADCVESPYLHTDAGSMADVVPSRDSAPVMCSIQFFLSPLTEESMGNFTCVPGSHLHQFPWTSDNPEHTQLRVAAPQGQDIDESARVQVCVEPGDAALFLHSLWHGVAENTSRTHRRSMIFSYARSFVRPYDYETTPATVLEAGTERQRRLFGDLGGWSFRPGCFYHYSDGIRATLRP